MSATIEINSPRATITAGEWFCADVAILKALNALYPDSYLPDGVNAREAVAKLGEKLISEDEEPEDEIDQDGTLVIF